MANKYEKLVASTIVEVAPIIAVAARAIGGAGRTMGRAVVGPKGKVSSGKSKIAVKKSKAAPVKPPSADQVGKTDKDWLKTGQNARNNRGTGGSNVVTGGNQTTNHTSNYNQVRKADLQTYSTTQQGQPPVKDDDAGNPLITQTGGNARQGSNPSKAEPKHVNDFKARVQAKQGTSKSNDGDDDSEKKQSAAGTIGSAAINTLYKHLS